MAEKNLEDGGLHGRVAIVTGGASGIGRATCLALARQGVRLAVADINQTGIDEVLGTLKTEVSGLNLSDAPLGLPVNVRSEQDMAEMARRTLEHFGRIDILVHSSGILRPPGSRPMFLHQVSLEEWDAVVDTNLKGTFLSNRAVLPAMVQQRQGHIINISSTSGIKGRPFDSVYCASKFGVVGLTEALAEEVRQYGIKVHVVLPDAVDTPIWEQNAPIQAPEGSLAPERVADVICYLISMPQDTVFGNLVIQPFKSRRRKKGPKNSLV
jgi:NAD(P)-dependent dehydrogenase (short-subunit alcohol dehydrogenase family)